MPGLRSLFLDLPEGADLYWVKYQNKEESRRPTPYLSLRTGGYERSVLLVRESVGPSQGENQ
jgi:hypothetical protein